MKILLTTIVDNINFGTYLQAFATAHVLEQRGADVEILNYTRPYLDGKYYAKKILNEGKKNYYKRIIRSFGYYILNGYMIWNLKRFLANKVKLTKTITSHDEFVKNFSGKYDLYLTGSDQVWNTGHNHGVDQIFYLAGIKGEKASYSSSVGIESFDDDEKKMIFQMLSEYGMISVRESSGVKALEEIGLKNIVQVLDPTLLITGKEWTDISCNKFKKTEKYVLIYSVEVSKTWDVYQIALKIAKERGLKVYFISPTLKFKKDFPLVDRLFSLADEEMFISLFSQADYIVCSSFHGTAFSINFNKPFLTYAPDNRFSTRVLSLLKLLDLEERYVQDIKDIPCNDIDYSSVNEILGKERVRSMNYIDKMIANFNTVK